MDSTNNRHNSIYCVATYYHQYSSLRKNHYPCFKLRQEDAFFITLKDAEDYVAAKGEAYKATSKKNEHTHLGVYAYVITEIPVGIDLNLNVLGQSLSERTYLPNGELWTVRDYCNFMPSVVSDEERMFWEEKCHFHGRKEKEIRFQPGDIVEVFGYPGNAYWDDDTVELAIVVRPPQSEDGICADIYEVLSLSCDEIDHAPTIATFSPRLDVPKRISNKLIELYKKHITT